MCMKLLKTGVLVVVGTVIIGGAIFGRDLMSYVHSSVRSVRTAVKDSVPIEFELKRARAGGSGLEDLSRFSSERAGAST